MRIKLLVLAILFLLFKTTPALAVLFSISNPQYNGEEVTLDVSVSGLASNSCPHNYCYLQAAFTAPSPTRYFGFTKNHNGQWYEYSGSPDPIYIQSTFFAFLPSGGSWTGQLTLKINPNDTDYKGSGTYNIKAWRYTGNSSTAANTSNLITINITEPSPSPTPTPTPIPTPIPTPTPSPTPKPTSSFTISNIPSQINSDQSFSVSVDLTLPNNNNTTYYLSGALKKVDGTRYFGLTKINSSWISYNSSNYLNQYKITTDDSGSWTGTLEVKPDTQDSDYKGSGDYIFKVARYLSGSSPTWSNESTIKIVSAENNHDRTSTNTLSPAPSNFLNTSNTPNLPKTTNRPIYKIASVAGIITSATPSSTPTTQVSVKNPRQTNPLFWAGLIFIFTGAGSIGYIYLKSNGKIPFKF